MGKTFPRSSGILLHITSLPGPYGVGSLGKEAAAFADFLAESGQRCWQILPVTPTAEESGWSPYSSTSAFAGNALFIDPESLYEEGLLKQEELLPPSGVPKTKAAFRKALNFKEALLGRAFQRFKKRKRVPQSYTRFCAGQAHWLEDYALFASLRKHFNEKPWIEWPPPVRNRTSEGLRQAAADLEEALAYERFIQWEFSRQWSALKKRCKKHGITLIGDVPFYVRHDSADVWVHRDGFKLDKQGKPLCVAGVPPDYFSRTGQLWNNPIYRWKTLKKQDYLWWRRRIVRSLELFDFLRIDHFRGFQAHWEVPPEERTAENGKWTAGPGADLFTHLEEHFSHLPLIAEDLGVITDDVRMLIDRFDFPGNRVLQFGFGKKAALSPHAPHNHVRNCIVYPGTHDNNTARGWFENEATEEKRNRLERYVGRKMTGKKAADALVELAMMSVADLCIIPLQDVLQLGEGARLNLPGRPHDNWKWRVQKRRLTDELSRSLKERTALYGR